MRGHDLIRAERIRQEQSEHYTVERDKGRSRELLQAAGSYILAANDKAIDSDHPPYLWPWENEYWKPKTTKRDLIRAGALVAAAIDALQEEEKTYE